MQKVSAALVAAQRAFGPALKTHTNPAFRSKYADLSACVEAVIDALNASGIALVQRNVACESGVCIETVFVHESGESLSSGPLHVPAAKQDAQGYGSAQTYARRYSLMAACGIAPEDDDGAAATKARPRSAGGAIKVADGAGGVIKATDGAAAGVSEDGRDRMAEVVLVMIEADKSGEPQRAADIWYDDASFADNDERVYAWSLLARESKLRRYIKDHNPRDQHQKRAA